MKFSVYGYVLLFTFLVPVQLNAEQQLRDPTRPYATLPESINESDELEVNQSKDPTNLGEELILQQIMIGHSRRMANINGVMLHVGDNIGDLKVLGIESDHVLILHQGAEKKLSFKHQGIRKKAGI